MKGKKELITLKKFIKSQENFLQRYIDNYSGEKVVLYGAGFALFWYVNYLQKNSICISYIIDGSEKKQGTLYRDIPIISLQSCIETVDMENVDIIITAPKFSEEIKAILKPYMNEKRIFEFECELYDNFITDIDAYRNYLLDKWSDVESFYYELSDEKSKQTLEAVLKGRITANQDYFKSVREDDQYYVEDVISLSDNESVIELGSNDGQTLINFLNKVNGKFSKFYCFEPDKECIEKLTSIISSYQNIDLVEKGAWNSTGKLSFSSDAEHGTSKIADEYEASYCIEVAAVDDIVDDVVTFIKMDIEGAEIKALEGAQKLIRKYKPMLAVCIYHRNEDLIEIPQYIHNLVPEYKFYLRHHNWGGTETVLYAKI